MQRRHIPDWLVDPAAPAVPGHDLDDEAFAAWHAAPAQPPGRARLVDDSHLQRTRHLIALRRMRRLERASAHPRDVVTGLCNIVALAAALVMPARKRGHPGHRARNDRLLALYEATSERLSHAHRWRLTATSYARETGRREMNPATVRDAIAEARRHREQLAQMQLFVDEHPPNG
jgi:hypothetical protein